jgi:5,10-methylenetetrahydrofolate reductase
MLPIIILSKSILKVSATEKISARNNEEDTMTFRESICHGVHIMAIGMEEKVPLIMEKAGLI